MFLMIESWGPKLHLKSIHPHHVHCPGPGLWVSKGRSARQLESCSSLRPDLKCRDKRWLSSGLHTCPYMFIVSTPEIKIKNIDRSIVMIHDPIVQTSYFRPRLYARSFYLSKVDEKLLKKFNSQYGGAFKANRKIYVDNYICNCIKFKPECASWNK